ncbi:MAG: hypothetical protein WBQ23_09560 [Bacteroidota bacterium]
MLSFISSRLVPSLGRLLILLLSLSLWCGHAPDAPAPTEAQCVTVAASSLPTDSGCPCSDDDHHDSNCMCVCHTPTIPGMTFDAQSLLTAHNIFTDLPDFRYPSPTAAIYHPPKA